MKFSVGDRVHVSSIYGEQYGIGSVVEEYPPGSCRYSVMVDHVEAIRNFGENYLQLLCCAEKALPGDVIVLHSDPGRKRIVVEHHDKFQDHLDLNITWIMEDGGKRRWVQDNRYDIVEISGELLADTECPDCHGTGQITLLTSIVKCKCGGK